jgi:protein SCO1
MRADECSSRRWSRLSWVGLSVFALAYTANATSSDPATAQRVAVEQVPAQPVTVDPDKAMLASQAAVGGSLGSHQLIDQNGRPFDTTALRGQPLVISFIYTSCPFVCPTITQNLARAVDMARGVLGSNRFRVLSVSFDPAVDTPQRLRQFAAERGIAAPDWIFATADQATVDVLARETGFTYARMAAGMFDHLTQVTLLDAEGRIYRQVYGQDFEAPMIVDPLKRLALGSALPEPPLTEFIDKVRLLCTSYDPRSGKYRFDYTLIMEIAIGLSCILGMSVFVLRNWRQGRRAAPGG